MRFTEAQRKTLSDAMEFDVPIGTDGEGNVTNSPVYWVPDYVWSDETHDCVTDSEKWETLTGHSGQYGYHGAVMHESEFIGGGLADAILGEAGIYVAVMVYWDGEDDREEWQREADGPEVSGWAVLKYVGDDL